MFNCMCEVTKIKEMQTIQFCYILPVQYSDLLEVDDMTKDDANYKVCCVYSYSLHT